MENYFNYFTEIEEQFLKRRGGGLLLSTLDWALIETWKDAGVPLEAVLRGIDAAFDRYDERPSKSRKVNSLAYCSQEVLAASEHMKEEVKNAALEETSSGEGDTSRERHGIANADVIAFLRHNAEQIAAAKMPQGQGISAGPLALEVASNLRALADDLEHRSKPRLEDLERKLTVMEEKLFAVLLAATSDDQVVAVRAAADRELAPYRRKMIAAQIEQLHKQYIHKKLLEKYGLPRLSLFYM
ncbi:MAG TPA: hypothetical protein VN684_06275 [Terriglobales bacterium]|nr:hypothetical protein [Terriglobales bacterium]